MPVLTGRFPFSFSAFPFAAMFGAAAICAWQARSRRSLLLAGATLPLSFWGWTGSLGSVAGPLFVGREGLGGVAWFAWVGLLAGAVAMALAVIVLARLFIRRRLG